MASELLWTVKNRLIYVVNHCLPFSSNGYAVRTHMIAKGLAENGCEVIIVTRPGYPYDVNADDIELNHVENVQDGIRYIHLPEPRKNRGNHKEWIDLSESTYKNLFQIFKPTAVVTASNWELALPAGRAARSLKLPFIYEVRGFWEISRASVSPEFRDTKEFSRLVALESEAARSADKVFTLNRFMKEELILRGASPDKISIMPNGYPEQLLTDFNESRSENKVFTIGYVGSFTKYEGLELLIQAVAVLKNRGINVGLMMVGSSNPIGLNSPNCELTESFKNLASELAVRDKVKFISRVSSNDVAKYYDEIDLIVIPRKKLEVCDLVSPIKPLEAASRGKAMILSNLRPFTEFFNAEVAEKLSDWNPETLASHITKFFSDPKQLAILGNKALAWHMDNRKPNHVTNELANCVKLLPSGLQFGITNQRSKAKSKNQEPMAELAISEYQSVCFDSEEISKVSKQIIINCQPNQIIKLNGNIYQNHQEKSNSSLFIIKFDNLPPNKETANKIGASHSQKLGYFKYINMSKENNWQSEFSIPANCNRVELTFKTWYSIFDVSLSLNKIVAVNSFETHLKMALDKYGPKIPIHIIDGISGIYGSEDIAKNLRKVFDLGHISLANELLLFVQPEHKIKYARNINAVLGYMELAKRLPFIPNRISRKIENTDTVCMVAHTSLPFHSNGYATRTHEIAKQINKKHTLKVITRPGYPEDVVKTDILSREQVIDGVTYKNVEGAHYYDDSITDYILNASRVLLREFVAIKPKLVHAFSSIHNALPALIAARKLGIPFVYEVRGFWEVTRASVNEGWGNSERYEIEHNMEMFIAKHADQVVALTSGIKDELVKYGVESRNISIVSNAISSDKFSDAASDKKPLTNAETMNHTALIGYVGSIVEYEGLDDLIDALEIVHKKGIGFKLVIAGDGNKLDELKKKVQASSIPQLVNIMGRIPHSDVGELINTIDIMPLPRKPLPVCEMVSPLKPFESMICKKTLIGSSVQAIAEIIQHGETGLIFEKGNISDLADKIIELIENPEYRKQLGENAYHWVLKHKTWEKVSLRYKDIYSQAEHLCLELKSPTCSPLKLLVYGDVDLNYIDGSSIWAASITDVLSSIDYVEVDILLKSDPYMSKVIKQINHKDKAVRIISPSQFGKTKRLGADDAVSIIHKLHQDQNYDAILIRGEKIYSGLASAPEMEGTLWVYPIELLQKSDTDITDSDIIPLKKARKLLCQSPAFKVKLLELGFEDENIIFVPPMVPDKPQISRNFDICTPSKKIVYAGKFDRQWGVLEMFDTFHKLYQHDFSFELHVYGEKIHNPERCEDFENKIKEHLTSSGVYWHKGVERETVLKELPLYDLAWAWRLPELDKDTKEISTKFLEYSSASLPIVCLDGTMNISLLGNDYPLFVSDQSQLVDRVNGFFAEPSLLTESSKACYKAVTPFFFSEVATKHFKPALDLIRTNKEQTILVAGHDLKFINAHIKYFKEKGFRVLIDKWQGHEGHNELQSYEKLSMADAVICEWALGNSVWYSNRKLAKQTLMIRLHLQEESTEYPFNIAVENIDFFNFINHQVQRNVRKKFFENKQLGTFLPNYINYYDLCLPKAEGSEFNLGFIGIVPQRKRFDLALDLLEKLRMEDNRYKLRVKGKLPADFPWMQNRKEEMAFYDKMYERIDESPYLKDAVIFDGHGNDMDIWFAKIGYILSTSDFEGSHQAVAEGMASGCIPLILPWEGADELYPKSYVFQSIEEMSAKILEQKVTTVETKEIQAHVEPWDITALNNQLIQHLNLY